MSWQDTYGSRGTGASLGDQITVLKGTNEQLSQLVQVLQAIFPRVTGSFTLAAAATTTVTQPAIKATSIVLLMPSNAAAATLMGSAKALYVSALAPGASFTVATASGASAAGTETFSYVVSNSS